MFVIALPYPETEGLSNQVNRLGGRSARIVLQYRDIASPDASQADLTPLLSVQNVPLRELHPSDTSDLMTAELAEVMTNSVSANTTIPCPRCSRIVTLAILGQDTVSNFGHFNEAATPWC